VKRKYIGEGKTLADTIASLEDELAWASNNAISIYITKPSGKELQVTNVNGAFVEGTLRPVIVALIQTNLDAKNAEYNALDIKP